MSHCPRCQSPLPDASARFCPVCGAGVTEEAHSMAPLGSGAPPPHAPADARCALHPDVSAVEVCARCGAFVCRECLVVQSDGSAMCAACHARIGGAAWVVPWERRSETGWLRAYWQTSKAAMFAPVSSFEGLTPSTGRWWDPISYAVVSAAAWVSGLVLFYGAVLGIGAVAAAVESSKPGEGLATLGVGGVATALGFLVAVPFIALAKIFLLGGMEHLLLRLLGTSTRGFEATVRAAAYAQGPLIFGLVPGCGYYVAAVWDVVARIFAYRGVHRTTGWRATAAVVLPVVLCCGGYALVVVFVGVFGAAPGG